LRFLLVEAGHSAVCKDAELSRCYRRLQHRHSTGVAKLALRLYWMLRRQTDYAQLPAVRMQASPCHSVVESKTVRLSGQPASL
jgi:hypothetical protein